MSFGSHGVVSSVPGFTSAEVHELEAYPDGRLLATGYGESEGRRHAFVARFLVGGEPDHSFSGDGVVAIDASVASVSAASPQLGGSLFIGGSLRGTDGYVSTDGYIARLSESGELDASFSDDGVATLPGLFFDDLSVDASGRIASVGDGRDEPLFVARHLPTGELDAMFANDGLWFPNPDDTVDLPLDVPNGEFEIDLLGNSGLVAMAHYTSLNAKPGFWSRVFKLDASGVPDSTFVQDLTDDLLGDRFGGMAIDSADGLVFTHAERFRTPRDRDAFGILRFNPNGTPDEGFGVGGTAVVNVTDGDDWIRSVGLQSHGGIVAAGKADEKVAVARFRVDPGAANADADPLTDEVDRCPIMYGVRRSGCPKGRPNIRLTVRPLEEPRRFAGYVSSTDRLCVPGSGGPEILRREPGQDKVIGKSEMDYAPDRPDGRHVGRFALQKPPRPGTYYARLSRRFEAVMGICKGARSPDLRIK